MAEKQELEIDFIRDILEILKLQQSQMDNLQKQIDIIKARTREELNAAIDDRVAAAKNRIKEEPSPNLNELHKAAMGDEHPRHEDTE